MGIEFTALCLNCPGFADFPAKCHVLYSLILAWEEMHRWGRGITEARNLSISWGRELC